MMEILLRRSEAIQEALFINGLNRHSVCLLHAAMALLWILLISTVVDSYPMIGFNRGSGIPLHRNELRKVHCTTTGNDTVVS